MMMLLPVLSVLGLVHLIPNKKQIAPPTGLEPDRALQKIEKITGNALTGEQITEIIKQSAIVLESSNTVVYGDKTKVFIIDLEQEDEK